MDGPHREAIHRQTFHGLLLRNFSAEEILSPHTLLSAFCTVDTIARACRHRHGGKAPTQKVSSGRKTKTSRKMLLLDAIVAVLAQGNSSQGNSPDCTTEELHEMRLTRSSTTSMVGVALAPVISSEDLALGSVDPQQQNHERQQGSSVSIDFQDCSTSFLENQSPAQSSENTNDPFSTEMPLEVIFSKLVQSNEEKRKDCQQQPSLSCQTSKISVPFQWEAEPGKPKESVAEEPPSPLSPPPLTYSPTFSSPMSKHQSFSGIFKSLIQGKRTRSASLTASFKFSCSSPSSDAKIHHHHGYIPEEQAPKVQSPTTVLHHHDHGTTTGSSTSSRDTMPVRDLNSILPFPASFPSVLSPMEALLLANSRTFSFSMSQAVPDSPELHAVSPLSFDTGSPFEHQLPGRYDHLANVKLDRAKSGPEKKLTYGNPRTLNKSISFSGATNPHDLLPSKTAHLAANRSKSSASMWQMNGNMDTNQKNMHLFVKSPEHLSSRSSSKNSDTSSEFSIELSGRLSGPAGGLSSSRYLDLDFRNEDLRTYQSNNKDKDSYYDVKSDIRSRVEEVVRNTDESKFTFSPVASSFLFAKSASHETNAGLFSANLDGYVEPEAAADRTVSNTPCNLVEQMSRNGSSQQKETRKIRTSWFFWISCCVRS